MPAKNRIYNIFLVNPEMPGKILSKRKANIPGADDTDRFIEKFV